MTKICVIPAFRISESAANPHWNHENSAVDPFSRNEDVGGSSPPVGFPAGTPKAQQTAGFVDRTDRTQRTPAGPVSDQTTCAKPASVGYEPRLVARFWRHVDKDGPNGCWVWTASKVKGYGQFRMGGNPLRAHRIAWELANGSAPARMQLDHLCRNPACVNPDHLEPVTAAVNQQRGVNAKLTWDIVGHIRASPDSLSVLASRFGVDPKVVWEVRKFKAWVPDDAEAGS